MSLTPRSPVRADHRFIRRLLDGTFKGKIEHRAEEYNLVSRVFKKAGGSWASVFHGSPKDINLLKKIISLAIKKGYMTKKEKWV